MNRNRKKFVNPLNKQIGRRTGRDFKAGKTIRVKNDGLEDFNDYLSESDADSICLSEKRTKKGPAIIDDKENETTYTNSLLAQSVPIPDKISMVSNMTGDVTTLSQNSQHPQVKKRSRFDWLRNRNIGRRTGKDMRANKNIRLMKNGLENFDDYLSDSEAESFLSDSTSQSKSSQKAAHPRRSSGLTTESKLANDTAHDRTKDDDESESDRESETRVNNTQNASSEGETTHRNMTVESVAKTTFDEVDSFRTSDITGTTVNADDHTFPNTTNKSRNSLKKSNNIYNKASVTQKFVRENTEEETNEEELGEAATGTTVNDDDHTFSNTTNKSRNSMNGSNYRNNRASVTKSFLKESSEEETNEEELGEVATGSTVNDDDHTFSNTTNKSRNSLKMSNNSYNKASVTKKIVKENSEEETNEISDEKESGEVATGTTVNADYHTFSKTTNQSRYSMKKSNNRNNRASVTKSFLKESSETNEGSVEAATGNTVNDDDHKSRNSMKKSNNSYNRASVTKSFVKENSDEETNEISDEEEGATGSTVNADDHTFSNTTNKSRNSMKKSNNSYNRASVTKSFVKEKSDEETNEISDEEESGEVASGTRVNADDHKFSNTTNKARNSMKKSNNRYNRASVTKSFVNENSEEETNEISDKEESKAYTGSTVNADDYTFSKITNKSRNSMKKSNNGNNRASVTKPFLKESSEEKTNEISDEEESGEADEGTIESEHEQVEELEIVDKAKEIKVNSDEEESVEEVEDDQNFHVEDRNEDEFKGAVKSDIDVIDDGDVKDKRDDDLQSDEEDEEVGEGEDLPNNDGGESSQEEHLQGGDEVDHEYEIEKTAANKTAQTGSNTCLDVNERINGDSLEKEQYIARRDDDDGAECLDENDTDNSDTRPSQALSGMDVAGNKSGSITKLSDPGSTVSFNKTKKRLSYSTLELSEESKISRANRLEAANIELAKEELDTPSEVQIVSDEKIQKKKQTTQKQQKQTKNNENVSHRYVKSDTDNFLSLSARSSHINLFGHPVISDAEDDMDISFVDDIKSNFRTKHLHGTGKSQKSGRNKTTENISKQGCKLKQTRNTKSVRKNITTQSSKNVTSENEHGKSESKGKNNAKNKIDKVNRKLADYLDITNDEDDSANEEPASDRQFENDEHFIDNHLPEIDDNEETVEESLQKLDKGKKGDKKNASKQKQGNYANAKAVKMKNYSDLSMEYVSPKKKVIQNKTKAQSKNNTKKRKSSSESSSDMDNNGPDTKSESKGKNKPKNKVDKVNRKLADYLDITNDEDDSDNEEPASDRQFENDEHFIDNHLPEIDDNEEAMEESLQKLDKGKKGDKKKDYSRQKQGNANAKNVKRKIPSDLSIEYASPKKKGKTNKKQDLNSTEKVIQNKTRAQSKNYTKKRKSSSEDSSDMDNNGQDTTMSKTKKMSQHHSKGSTGRRSSSSPKSGLSHTASSYTPEPDSRQVTTNLESGVSFRVSRRSELLQNVTSGPLTGASPIEVVVEPSEGLTPCLSKKGQPRKRKGRRVTICPEENTHHLLSADESLLKETINNPKTFRHSMGLSDVGTPLPSPNSTPMHIFECTMTKTPMSLSKLPKSYAELPIEDRCIHPEPAPEGLRRSQRTRLRPVATFEEIIWEDRPDIGPVIVGVKPSMEVVYKKQEEIKRQKRRLKLALLKVTKEKVGKKSNRKLSIHVDMPEDFEDFDKTDVTVVDPDTQDSVGIECIAYKNSFQAVGPDGNSPKSSDPFCVTKLFDQFCMSAGKLEIRPTRTKPLSRVGEQALVFRILRGKVLVTIHETTTLVETDDTFFVPFGNVYSIRNMRNDTAELFYTVHKFPDKEKSVIDS